MSSIDDTTSIILNNAQKDILNSYLNSEGKLPCIDGFKVAHKLGIDRFKISGVCKSMGIKITDCELGVFGSLDFIAFDPALYNTILETTNGEKRITCEQYWEFAKTSKLKKVGATVKKSDLEVTYCQLGCFREKKGKHESKS